MGKEKAQRSEGCADNTSGQLSLAFIDLQISHLEGLLDEWKAHRQSMLDGKPSVPPHLSAAPRGQEKNRPTKAEMANRNRTVAVAATRFTAEHDRLPDVHEIMIVTGLQQKQVYATDPYKEGKISRRSATLTGELVGSSVHETEYFGRNSTQHSRANRRSKSDQAELDALVEEHKRDDKSSFVT